MYNRVEEKISNIYSIFSNCKIKQISISRAYFLGNDFPDLTIELFISVDNIPTFQFSRAYYFIYSVKTPEFLSHDSSFHKFWACKYRQFETWSASNDRIDTRGHLTDCNAQRRQPSYEKVSGNFLRWVLVCTTGHKAHGQDRATLVRERAYFWESPSVDGLAWILVIRRAVRGEKIFSIRRRRIVITEFPKNLTRWIEPATRFWKSPPIILDNGFRMASTSASENGSLTRIDFTHESHRSR